MLDVGRGRQEAAHLVRGQDVGSRTVFPEAANASHDTRALQRRKAIAQGCNRDIGSRWAQLLGSHQAEQPTADVFPFELIGAEPKMRLEVPDVLEVYLVCASRQCSNIVV
jgi:hypothetical protein